MAIAWPRIHFSQEVFIWDYEIILTWNIILKVFFFLFLWPGEQFNKWLLAKISNFKVFWVLWHGLHSCICLLWLKISHWLSFSLHKVRVAKEEGVEFDCHYCCQVDDHRGLALVGVNRGHMEVLSKCWMTELWGIFGNPQTGPEGWCWTCKKLAVKSWYVGPEYYTSGLSHSIKLRLFCFGGLI